MRFVRKTFRCLRPVPPAFFVFWVKSGSGAACASNEDLHVAKADFADIHRGWLTSFSKAGCREGRYTVGHASQTDQAIIKNVLGKMQKEVKEKLKKAIEENTRLQLHF